MYKPAYGQTLYEVTDHLGNVRAVIGGSVQTTMLATMEQERHAKESQAFFGMRTTVSATDINHTTATVTVDGETDIVEPNEVIRLNNRPNGRYSPNPIGGGTMLWVHPGDTIRAEVFAKYARLEQSQNKSQLIAMAAMMKNLSPIDNAVEMRKAFQMLGSSNFRSLPAWGKLDDGQPPAFLNGLLFDKDMKLQTFDFDQVSEKARMKAIEDNKDHEKLELEFVAEKEGYLYIYISNESKENLDVYFDDLKVTHVYGTVVAGGDYYPFGLPIEDRQITLEDYRFGYQGQFAERDDETGWNHFESREYEPTLGRWMTTDPKRQFDSPYAALGNNPISVMDPNGEWASQYGFYVHQTAIKYSLWRMFRLSEVKGSDFQRNYSSFLMYRDILNKATEFADSEEFQNGLSSFRHAMRNGNQTPLEGRALANAFVRAQFNKAFALRAAGNEGQAIFEYGLGLHVLQDASSPAHGGFQEWTGEEGFFQTVGHVLKELFYPGYDSNLQRVTDQAMEWYESGALPDGDLFENIEIDD